jgi:ABC-2 type transport system permease protein
MASFSTLMALEWSKIIRRPMTWILVVIFGGFMGFMYMALALVSLISEVEGAEEMDLAGLENQMLLPDGLSFGSALVIGVGAVVMIVFAAGLFGSEFGWATIRTVLLMRGPRIPLVFAKVVMVGVFSLVFAAIGMVIAFVGSIVFEFAWAGSADVGGYLTGELLQDFAMITLRTAIGIAMWSLIAGMIALAFSSMGIGLGVALAAYFVGDLLIAVIAQLGTIGEWFARFMPTWGVNALVQMNQPQGANFSNAEMVGIVVNIVGYAAIFIALGIYRFYKMDVISAS